MAQQSDSTYGVFVSGIHRSPEEFEAHLVREGMSAARARGVVESMPCFVKRDVPLAVANEYKAAFERAGAWVVVENWQTTRNPAAYLGGPRRASDDEIPLPPPRPPRKTPRGTTPLRTDVRPPASGPEATTLREPAPKRHAVRSWRPPEIVPEHWAKRHGPSAIAIALLLGIASYFYGCQKVMRQDHVMRGKVSDLSVALENLNALGAPVTDDDIVTEVKAVGAGVGLDIETDEIDITADEIVMDGTGRSCRVVSMPDTVALLPQYEKDIILRNARTCNLPRWIVGIHVRHDARWGLYSHTIEFTRYVPVREYVP